MSFTKSLLTTLGIFIVVWGAVFLNTSKYPDASASHAVASPKISKPDSIKLVGLQKAISLGDNGDQLKVLWDKFYEANSLHMAVDQEASRRAFAYYEFNNADLNDANVTIGYNTEGKDVFGYSSPPAISIKAYEQIYESNELRDTTLGWNEINEDREAHSVLEEYLIGTGGEIVNTKVYILYKW
jgi:hypothetical protein